jgi:hypothetical protein
MHMIGAEMRVTCGMLAAGLKVHAPCAHVRLSHWHCEAKTHNGKQRYDKGGFIPLIDDYVRKHPEFGVPGTCIPRLNVCQQGNGNCGGIT